MKQSLAVQRLGSFVIATSLEDSLLAMTGRASFSSTLMHRACNSRH